MAYMLVQWLLTLPFHHYPFCLLMDHVPDSVHRAFLGGNIWSLMDADNW